MGNADALRGTVTGNDAPLPTIEGAAADLASALRGVVERMTCRESHDCIAVHGPVLTLALVALGSYERLTPSNVGRAHEDAAAGSPQGAADHA